MDGEGKLQQCEVTFVSGPLDAGPASADLSVGTWFPCQLFAPLPQQSFILHNSEILPLNWPEHQSCIFID